jgi:putative toxin-antitoxin system antitoxin component (TIGR02293 family)
MAKHGVVRDTPLLGTPDLEELRSRGRDGDPQGHGYVALLGLRSYEPLRIVASVRKGLPYSALLRLQRNTGLSASVLAEVAQIPARTLARRKQLGKLDPDESDRLVRVARVFGRAFELFEGDVRIARDWLSTPQIALGGRAPLELAKTDVGAREVENLVGRLEHGIAT